VVAEVLQRGGAALRRAAVLPNACVVAADEAHHEPGAAVRRRGVEGDLDRAVLADDLGREALRAPEGRVVDRLELHQSAVWHVLRELISQWRERRLVVDAPR